MDFKDLVTTKFLFEINRLSIEQSDKIFFAIGLALVILGIVFKLAEIFSPTPADKKYRRRFFTILFTIGLLEVLWFGFRFQTIRFFGTHFAAILILAAGAFWAVFAIKDLVRNYRKEKQVWEKEQVRLKYLPGYRQPISRKKESRDTEEAAKNRNQDKAGAVGGEPGGEV